MDNYGAFAERLRDLIGTREQLDRAAELTTAYWTKGYTGSQFHVFADDHHPNEITERDVLAVSMLGVNIPAAVTIWLLGDGRAQVSDLLSAIPTELDIWDAGELLGPERELEALWQLLKTACWPAPTSANGMGRTKISKLLAAKRRRLVPVYDSIVAGMLPSTPNHWIAFERALGGDGELRLLLSIASATGAPEGAGLLRRIDAMLWMMGNRANQ